MPYPLNNVELADTYTQATTLEPQRPGEKLNIILANNAAYMQVEVLRPGMRVGSGAFDVEEYIVPGAYSMVRNFGQVRFRSAIPTAGLDPDNELPRVTARAQ